MKQTKKRSGTKIIKRRSRRSVSRRSVSRKNLDETKHIQNLVIRILILINIVGTLYGTINISKQQLLTQDSSILMNILVTLVSFIAGLGISVESSKLLLNITEGFHDMPKIENFDELKEKISKTLENP